MPNSPTSRGCVLGEYACESQGPQHEGQQELEAADHGQQQDHDEDHKGDDHAAAQMHALRIRHPREALERTEADNSLTPTKEPNMNPTTNYAVLPGADLDEAFSIELVRRSTECECSPSSHWREDSQGNERRIICGCVCDACGEY